MTLRIEDYAIIGDCETCAMVGSDGSIDWLCFERLDAAACFAALLGDSSHGRWQIAPHLPEGQMVQTKRRYVDDTLVLETEFHFPDGGVVVLTDFMPIRDDRSDVVRIVEARGEADVALPMQMELIIRFDYGSIIPWVQRIHPTKGIPAVGKGAADISPPEAPWCRASLWAIAGPDSLRFRSAVPLVNKDFRTTAEFSVKPGEPLFFTLTWHRSYDPSDASPHPDAALEETLSFWRDWSARCTYRGPWRDAVMRSLITLKALTFAKSGGIAAAATTSLPEQLGGVRNWDYRYCWLRDSTLTLLAFLRCGYSDEACAWRIWLLRAIAGDPADLQIMYGLAGERRLTEYEINWLPGYEKSAPVRVGNAASKQFQLDVYGEVLDTLHQARKAKLEANDAGWELEKVLLAFVVDSWDKPDEGIWEVRGPRRHFTHSKVMAWVALDRGIHAVEHFGRKGPVEQWRRVRDRIHAEVCEKGFSPRLNSFVQSFETEFLDASLLMIPLVGFLPPEDPRVVGTVDAIQKHLMRDGFVLRYDTSKSDDGLPPGEGAFLACSFWLVDCLTLIGRHDEAQTMFERLMTLRNDVGLLSEEYDHNANRLIGNFPQAFSHLALVGAALNLRQAKHGPVKDRAEEREASSEKKK